MANPNDSSGSPNIVWIVGRRKSASMTRTRFPDLAIVTAKLATHVDFPSPGSGLEIWITLWFCPLVLKYSDVRTDLYASEGMELWRCTVQTTEAKFENSSDTIWFFRLIKGMLPMIGALSVSRISSGLRKVFSDRSTNQAREKPLNMPRKTDPTATKRIWGNTCFYQGLEVHLVIC